MADFVEIDFLAVETEKSGDAITLRYELNGGVGIHVVDAGYQDTGPSVVQHIKTYYGNPQRIDRIVSSHPDGDHAGGLRTVIESFEVGELWMLRPWIYAAQLLEKFARVTSVENLERLLREAYPYIAELETIALDRGIPIYEPLQLTRIGPFTVLAPSLERYLQLIVSSDKTPQPATEPEAALAGSLMRLLSESFGKVVALIRSAWGEEVFSTDETSAENEMSVVQFGEIVGRKILLTADAGRGALMEAADQAPLVGLKLPGLKWFQVPHHGSRRNVSTELLDRWLGPGLSAPLPQGQEKFEAIVSSAAKDKDHPRKAVVRALIHRGGFVAATENRTIQIGYNAPPRPGWVSISPMPYPDEQEQ